MTYIATRDGTRLYVKKWGEGRPVVLIHGWPLSSDTWDVQALALAEAGFQTIAYDRRGFGRSDQPWHGYDYDTFADDLADVMKETGATGEVALVGFSMGGGEIARYMSRHKGVGVTRTVLISSVVPFLLQTAGNPDGVPYETFDDMAEKMKRDRPAFMYEFLNNFYGVGLLSSPVSKEVLEWSLRMAMQAGLHSTLASALAFSQTDFRAELEAFTVPTLVIHGTADATVPIEATGRVAGELIPKASLIEYHGGPHGLLVTHQDRVTADLLEFLPQ